MSRFSKISFAALAITLIAAGCVERPPRSFVQPNVIKKSDLEGSWYYIQTVTDAPVTSSEFFIGNSSELMKVKFDVQEGTLYARRAYEQIADTEDAYTQDPKKYGGQPLAAWPISSQFDIIRDYNSTTGEESNKIIESTERAWNQREFIRVDWSQNVLLPSDVVGLGINFLFADGVSVQPGSYWESDPTKPDAFRMERADATDSAEFAAGEANYFDVTNKWIVNPTPITLTFEEGGKTEHLTYPACFLSYQLDDCASQVVKVRHAFAKLSPKHQYQPRKWDGKQMDLFGIWDVGLNRLTYNRQYGVTNSGFSRHAARFNLWKESFQEDGKTPIPYAEREQRTIPYYAESSLEPFPVELFTTFADVVGQWNAAVKVAVQDVSKKPMAEIQDVFVPCHNPVKIKADSMGAADPAACIANIKPLRDARGEIIKDDNGDPIYKARQGDPRRSTIFWVNQQQNGGPLGYGPPLFDIETGETISGQAYIYGAAVDSYTARSRDLVLLLVGRLNANDYIAGQNIQDWVGKNRSGRGADHPTYEKSEISERVAAMDYSWATGQAPEAPIINTDMKSFMNSIRDREDALYKSGMFGYSNANLGQLKRDRLRGGTIEGMMVTSDMIAMGGAKPGTDWTALSAEEKSRISPLRTRAVIRAIEDRLDKMRTFGYDFADFADEGMAQRALNLANDPGIPNMDPEAIRQKLRKEIFLGVTLHEMGHNVGLRHNFRASYDSMNYFPDYWKLRDAAAKNPNAKRYVGIDTTTGQAKGVAFNGGADCVSTGVGGRKGTIRPRYIDCPGGATSVEEVMGGIRERQYSSIMDYGAEFNSDFLGLGLYDKAAMKFSYAGDGYVEVFTDAKTDNATQLKFAAIHAFQGAFGFASPLGLGQAASSINYTSYPTLFNSGVDGIYKRKDVPFSELEASGPGGYIRADKAGNPAVPYYFCSDEFASNLTCRRFDSGADVYEQARDIISRYENFYLLNNFKRDRYTFHSSLAYKSRIASRYLEILQSQMTWYSLLRADFQDFFGEAGNDAFWANEDGWQSFSLAVTEGFDLIGRILSTPEAGSYSFVQGGVNPDYPQGVYKKATDNTTPGTGQVGVGLIDGKYASTTWDFDGCGYYWADECQTRIGYFTDKTIALDILSESQAYFTGRDTSTDVRKYAIGYILPFRKQIQEKLGALFAGDFVSFAPRVAKSGNMASVKQPSWTLNNATTPDNGDVIDPATGFTLQLYAGVYGLSEFPTTFDRSFVDTTRIFVLGNGEAPVSDAELAAKGTNDPTQLTGNGGAKDWLLVLDTETGKTYAAHSSPKVQDRPTGPTYRNDTGVRMLETFRTMLGTTCGGAGQLTCNGKALMLTKYRQNLDVMRALHNAFGYGTYKTDNPFLY